MDNHELSFNPCMAKFEGNTVVFRVDVNGKEENLTAEQILSSFMTHLCSIIEHNNLDAKLIIFTIPSFFT
jgi:hypothetical protein